jgi:signal transduction histidine kinase
VSAYRIVQEAITNSLKHEGHSHRDTIQWTNNLLAIEVADNGRQVDSASRPGYGLIGLASGRCSTAPW